MTRLIVVVEGQTEEAFVNSVLAPHLLSRDVYATATIVGKVNAQRRGHRGRGGGHFRHWRRDLERVLGGDRNADLRVTTLFDLYGLPQLEASIREFAPEDINDGTETAPSKRLLASVPGYVKTLHGPLAVADTGMATVRARCPRFDAWVSKLETLGQ